MNTKAVAGGAIALIAVGGWLGAAGWSSRVAEAELKAMVEKSGATSLRISKLDHHSGFFSSTGRAEIALVDRCGKSSNADGIVSVEVDYKLSHLVTPTALMRFEWSLQPAGKSGKTFAEIFGSSVKLSGAGGVTFARNVESTLALPAMNWRGEGKSFETSPSSGRVLVGATDLRVTWSTDRLVARGDGEAFEVQNVAFNADMRNRARGTGTSSLSIGSISTSAGKLEGLKLTSEVSERGDRLDAMFKPEVKLVSFAGQSLADLSLEVAVRGLHGASVEAIGKLLDDVCDVADLTADESERLSKSVRALLAEGFSFGMPKLTGTMGAGRLEGNLIVDIAKSPANVAAIADRIQSSGQLKVSGNVLTPDQKQMAVAMTGATESGDGISLGYSFAAGKLQFNGRSIDARPVTQALRMADEQIAAFLQSPRKVAAAPVQAPAAAPVTEQAEAEEDSEPQQPRVENVAGRTRD